MSCDPSDSGCLPGPGQCGLAKDVVEGEVEEGRAKPGQFPFTAIIGRRRQLRKKLKCLSAEANDPDCRNPYEIRYRWQCGGVLINQWYVLSDAHCFSRKLKGEEELVVRLGAYLIDDEEDDCTGPDCWLTQDFIVDESLVVAHPDYETNRKGAINDIALLPLPRQARLTQGVAVACVPVDPVLTAAQLGLPDIGEALEGRVGHMVGWGYASEEERLDGDKGYINKVATHLQKNALVPIVSDTECVRVFEEISPGFTIPSSQFCAGEGEVGKGGCSVSII